MSKFKVEKGDKVRCVVEVYKHDRLAFNNIYEGNVIEITEENSNLAFVKIQGEDRLIPVERKVIGKIF